MYARETSICKLRGSKWRDFFTDPPPMKWSGLRYVSDVKKDSNAKEAIQAEEIVAKAVATRNPLSYSSLLTLVKNGSTAAPAFPARQSAIRGFALLLR